MTITGDAAKSLSATWISGPSAASTKLVAHQKANGVRIPLFTLHDKNSETARLRFRPAIRRRFHFRRGQKQPLALGIQRHGFGALLSLDIANGFVLVRALLMHDRNRTAAVRSEYQLVIGVERYRIHALADGKR